MNCEICGRDVPEVREVKIEDAKLNACRNCQDLGTVVEQEDEKDQNTTKYSTSTSSSSNQRSDSQSSNKQYNDRQNSFDKVSNLSRNFGDKIRDKRASRGDSREELAHELGIKQSHLRNIENEDATPSINLQQKIESELDIDLSLDDELRS